MAERHLDDDGWMEHLNDEAAAEADKQAVREAYSEKVFRQTFMDNNGNVTYGPEEIIDAGPFAHPGIGSFVELEDGWYRLRRKVAKDDE